ncbi:MAG: hypothetical protein B7Z62_08070 [Deltaproteobacteria bacterium 37-65-8]|nr:MAG: hypothetical protein B7Z62_08070 [Deltaproteobacteria bacterium 37-65-8]
MTFRMRGGGGKRLGGWCLVLLLVLALPVPRAWADAGSGRADGLCAKAETAEREARDYERKSEERQRFLKGKGGIASRNGTLPIGGDTAAVRQSAKAKIAEVRALLPQLRQGAAAAVRDRGIVPGLSQYFTRLESDLGRMLQAADACLDAPQYCTVPPISCPPVPGMPSFNNSGSASFILQVQQSYAQSANKLRQACQNLNAGIVGDVERLKMGSRSAGTMGGLPGIAPARPFGETDLYLRRAENLRREASLSRREADRVSGVRGYCGARSHFRIDAKTSHAVVESLKAAERRRKSEADFPLDAKVIDLKTEWEKKWNKEMALNAPNGPLPKLTGGEGKSTAVLQEQAEFENRNADWMEKQRLLVEERLREPNEYASAIYKSLKTNAPPPPAKTLDKLQSGDVLLIEGKAIAYLDNKLSVGNDTSSASHTVLYLKEVKGEKLFMDNQPFEGPRIISEDEFEHLYGSRQAQVAKLAQPLNEQEGKKLFTAAVEMAQKNRKEITDNWFGTPLLGTSYGAWGKENVVCSEADWALINATGRNIPKSGDLVKRGLGVDFSPADYLNSRYFLVTPLW